MKGIFNITTGDAEVYDGLHISRNRNQCILQIDQSQYIQRKLDEYNFDTYASLSVPVDPHVLMSFMSSVDEATNSTFPCAKIFGGFHFASQMSCIDITYITYVTRHAFRFIEIPKISHISWAKQILKYLNGTSDLRIKYSASGETNILYAYRNTDYGGDLDNWKSRSGFESASLIITLI